MDLENLHAIGTWLGEAGIEGLSEVDLLHGFCDRCLAAGLPLGRAIVIIDTLHPIYEGRGFRWREDGEAEESVMEFKREEDDSHLTGWTSSPFHHLLERGGGELRFRLHLGEYGGFEAVQDLARQGQTDYLARVHRFAPGTVIGEMDNLASRWTTARPGGFSDEDIEALRYLETMLGLAIKSASLARVPLALATTYLGRDAARKVIGGRMDRGIADTMSAVIWSSDMRGYTTLSETIAVDEVIPLLNDYAEVVINAVHAAGGDVLKLIGDGVLAVFAGLDVPAACLAALRAEQAMRESLLALQSGRRAARRPVADLYVGLHVGDVFFGNIGSRDRLDFTVVGQAVNETARIAAMCRSVDRDVLVSTDFRAALPPAEQALLVSVGRFALRGVGRAQDLFTIDPALRPRQPSGG